MPQAYRNFSWISGIQYEATRSEGPKIKAQLKQNIVKMLGKNAAKFEQKDLDFLVSTEFYRIKDNLKEQEKFVKYLLDPDFTIENYINSKFNIPNQTMIKEEQKEIMSKNLLNDYEPEIEDMQKIIKIRDPPKGENLQHFTDLGIPENLRTPRNLLEILPGNGLVVTNLPDSVKYEEFRKMFTKYGKIKKSSLIYDINRRPMYFVILFEDKNCVKEAKKEMNNFYIDGTLLKAKTKENFKEEAVYLRTLYISNIPQAVRPEEIQTFLACYGKIVQIELPLIDTLQYTRINKALQKSESMLKSVDTTKSKRNDNLKGLIDMTENRKILRELRLNIFAELRKNTKEVSKSLIDNITRFVENLQTSDIAMIKSKNEADNAVELLNNIESIVNTKEKLSDSIIDRTTKCITNYLEYQDSEISKCIKNIPTFEQLIGSKQILPVSDINIGEKPAPKPEFDKDSNYFLKNLDVELNVGEYIRKNKEKLTELYEIFSESEVEKLLSRAKSKMPMAISVNDVVVNLIQNLHTYKKRNVTPSNEAGYRKEKALIELLVDTRKKLLTFAEKYKNHYEALYKEIKNIDPDAINLDKEIENSEYEKIRKKLIFEAAEKQNLGNKFLKFAGLENQAKLSKKISMEEVDKEYKEFRKNAMQHKGYCFVTFSTTVFLYE